MACEMYDRIVSNADEEMPDLDRKLPMAAAALLHDVGHGPFSHAMEEVLKTLGTRFNHEHLSIRIISEESEVNSRLREMDPQLPARLLPFIDKARRTPDHWTHRIVSSQLDADRLDYSVRDARMAGLQGHGYDMPRLLDMLHTKDGIRIAVDRHATEAVEAYLLMLEHLYRAIYFHPIIRCATFLLGSVFRRAFELYRNGKGNVFPKIAGRSHPLQSLVDHGDAIDLSEYVRLGEFHVWALIEGWQFHKDTILADLAARLMQRRSFKYLEVDPTDSARIHRLAGFAEGRVVRRLSHVDAQNRNLYTTIDEPARTSYKRYDWRSETTDESIWLTGGSRPTVALENEEGNSVIDGLKRTNHMHRIIFPQEILNEVLAEARVGS